MDSNLEHSSLCFSIPKAYAYLPARAPVRPPSKPPPRFHFTTSMMSRRRHRRMMESSHRNQGVTSLIRRNQAKSLIVWSSRVLVVILFIIVLKIHWYPKTTPSDTITAKMLEYKLVETGETRGELGFQRYVAVTSNERPVSVQEWAQVLASSDGASSDSFTRILKVCAFMYTVWIHVPVIYTSHHVHYRMLLMRPSFWKPRASLPRVLLRTLSLSW